MDDVTLRLAPGTGLVVRRPSALVYSAAPDHALVESFLAAEDGSELQALASATVGAGFAVGPFVALAWNRGTVRVMAFGDVAVETDQPSLPMLSGAGSRTWAEHTVPFDTDTVVDVHGADVDPATDLLAGTVLAGGFRLELAARTGGRALEPGPSERVGPTRAGTSTDDTTSVPRMERAPVVDPDPGVETDPAVREDPPVVDTAPRQPTPPPEPTPTPARADVDVDPDDPVAALAAIQAAAVGPDGQPFDDGMAGPRAVADTDSPEHQGGDHDQQDPDITLPPPASEALLADLRRSESGNGRGSLVDAKRCSEGHANPPTAATCGVCGEFLSPGGATIVHVPRPSLGRLHLDDGELVELDQELLVGRNPDRDDDPGRATLRRVKTLGEKVSRSHVEVRFQGWDVLVTDCSSTNGTFVVPHPGGQVVALEPGRPHLIDAGAVVYFGSRSFTLLGREESP